jgi:hypothetical protein
MVLDLVEEPKRYGNQQGSLTFSISKEATTYCNECRASSDLTLVLLLRENAHGGLVENRNI